MNIKSDFNKYNNFLINAKITTKIKINYIYISQKILY